MAAWHTERARHGEDNNGWAACSAAACLTMRGLTQRRAAALLAGWQAVDQQQHRAGMQSAHRPSPEILKEQDIRVGMAGANNSGVLTLTPHLQQSACKIAVTLLSSCTRYGSALSDTTCSGIGSSRLLSGLPYGMAFLRSPTWHCKAVTLYSSAPPYSSLHQQRASRGRRRRHM